MKKLLPNNIGSKVFISNEARKYYDKKSAHKESEKKDSIFPHYEGKIYDPTTNKTITFLRRAENQIIKELSKLNSNEKLLKNNSYLNQFNNNPNNLEKDQKLVDEKIKTIEKNRISYMMRLEEIKNQINLLQYKQKKELGIIDNDKKLKLSKFIEDYKNKESANLIEEKIKRLQEESEKIQLLMRKDLENKIKKKNEILDGIEKKEEEKRNEILKKMKEEERERIEIRKKKNTEKILKFKEFMRKKPEDLIYLYQKHKDNYIDKENNLVKLENEKRKQIMKHIDLKEFDEMRKNFEQMKSKRLKESNEKIKMIKQTWSQRFKLIPSYVNPLSKLVSEEENKMKEEEQNKILQRKNLKKLQQKYNVPKPQKFIVEKIIEKDKENKDNTNLNRQKPHLIKSNSYSDIIRKKMIDKYKAAQI